MSGVLVIQDCCLKSNAISIVNTEIDPELFYKKILDSMFYTPEYRVKNQGLIEVLFCLYKYPEEDMTDVFSFLIKAGELTTYELMRFMKIFKMYMSFELEKKQHLYKTCKEMEDKQIEKKITYIKTP